MGSVVGGYASFRGSEALEVKRRQARAKIRRKAKVYTPIRSELVALKERMSTGVHFNVWGIIRDEPPRLMRPPASLHLWKDLSDDGRSLTAASTKIRSDLDVIESLADSFNEQLEKTRRVFDACGTQILAEMGEEPRTVNWLDADVAALIDLRFDDLGVTGTRYDDGDMLPPEIANAFEASWRADQEIATATQEMSEVNSKLTAAINKALADLDAAIESIAKKYERESSED